MESQNSRLGIFVSYNEKNGNFEDAVDVCSAHDYIIWLEKLAVNTNRFLFPTTILVKIKGAKGY